jgi:hypothetical protein
MPQPGYRLSASDPAILPVGFLLKNKEGVSIMRTIAVMGLYFLSAVFSIASAYDKEQPFDNAHLGLSLGWGWNESGKGLSLGALQFGAIEKHLFFDGEIGQFSFGSNDGKFEVGFINLLTLDCGPGFTIAHHAYIGISPLSVNLTPSPCLGGSIIVKALLGFVIPYIKLVPLQYTKNSTDASIINRNAAFGVQIGMFDLRYSRYKTTNDVSLMFSYFWR